MKSPAAGSRNRRGSAERSVVQQRRHTTYEQQRNEKTRAPAARGRLDDQSAKIKCHAARHEASTKNPYPIASNLVRKFGSRRSPGESHRAGAPARKEPRIAVGLFTYNPYASSRCSHTSLTVGNDGTACRNISSGTAPAIATVAECSSS